MSSTTFLHLRKTTITAKVEQQNNGKKYGVLNLAQDNTALHIFLYDKEGVRDLLNAVRRIDRRLNQCQPKS